MEGADRDEWLRLLAAAYQEEARLIRDEARARDDWAWFVGELERVRADMRRHFATLARLDSTP